MIFLLKPLKMVADYTQDDKLSIKIVLGASMILFDNFFTKQLIIRITGIK